MNYEIVDDGGYIMIEINHDGRLVIQDYLGDSEAGEQYFQSWLRGLRLKFFDFLGVQEWWIIDSEGMVVEGAFYNIEKANDVLLELQGLNTQG